MVGKREGCFAVRFGAFGDIVYLLPTLERLKADYGYLHFDTGPQGGVVLVGNSTVDRISVFPIGAVEPKLRGVLMGAREEAINAVGWSKHVNFWRCLEVSCIAEIHQEEFGWPRERRREKFGSKNFIDEHLTRAGYPAGSLTDCGTWEFSDEELDWIQNFRIQNKDAFIVTVAPCGSTAQKVPIDLHLVTKEIVEKYPEAKIIVVGDKESFEIGNWHKHGERRLMNMAGRWQYRQAVAAVRISDFVIGPETSMLVIAGMFGIPKTMICTSCSVYQATCYHKNDCSIQSTVECSPCHRAIYQRLPDGRSTAIYCNFTDTYLGKIPSCNVEYSKESIMEGVKKAYEVRSLRWDNDDLTRKRVGSLPELWTPSVQQVRGDEKV